MEFTFLDAKKSAQAATEAARAGDIARAIEQLSYAVGQLASATEKAFKQRPPAQSGPSPSP
jgi:hypothetical protein